MRVLTTLLLVWALALAGEAMAQTPRPPELHYLYRIAQAQRELAGGRLARAEAVLESCPEALRGWEWHHLWRCCRPEAMRLTDAKYEIAEVAVDASGRKIASVTGAITRTYDARSGRLEHVFEFGGDGLVFTADGKTLAVAGKGTVTILDTVAGKSVGSIDAHDLRVAAVAFSPDGKRLVTCSGRHEGANRGELRIWDVATKRRVLQIEERLWVRTAAFHPDGTMLAVGTGGFHIKPPKPGELRIYDPTDGKVIRRFAGHSFWITDVAFSPDGLTLASASADMTVRLWDVATGKTRHVLRGHSGWVRSVSFDREGRRLLSAGDDKSLRVWDVETGRLLGQVKAHREAIRSAVFDPKRDRVVSAGAAKDGVRVFSFPFEPGTRTFRADGNEVTSVAISPDGNYVASARGSNPPGPLIVRSLADGKVVVSLPARVHHDRPCVVFSADSERIAVGTEQEVTIRHVRSGVELAKAKLAFSFQGVLAFGPKGKLLAVPVGKGAVLVNAKTGATVRTVGGHRTRVTQVAFSASGTLLVTGSMRGYTSTGDVPSVARVWDVATGRARSEFEGNFHSVVFAPRGNTIATGGTGGQIVEWDALTGKRKREFDGSVGWINGLAYSPDGKRLCSGGADGALRLWDTRTGMEVFATKAHETAVTNVAFCADGDTIVTGAADGTVRLWLTR